MYQKRATEIDLGFVRQAHQLVYSYLPGKVMAASPNIPGLPYIGLVNAKVGYPRFYNEKDRMNAILDAHVGRSIRERIPSFTGKFSFLELDSSISPDLKVFPIVMEVVLADGRKLAYWITDGENTAFSGSISNLVGKSPGRIVNIFPTDVVFCDSKNPNTEAYPIKQLDIPFFADKSSPIFIEGVDNWKTRRLLVTLPDGSERRLKPMAKYPQTFEQYVESESHSGWRSSPKKARGRETYVPRIHPEVFYKIDKETGDLAGYFVEWLSMKYSSLKDKISTNKDTAAYFKKTAEQWYVNDFSNQITTKALCAALDVFGITEPPESLKECPDTFRDDLDYLRFKSVKEKMELFSSDESVNDYVSWLSESGMETISKLKKEMKKKGIKEIGPSKKIEVANFVYGWMSGSYEIDNTIFRLPVFWNGKSDGNWPVLYYVFQSEGILVEFDNDLLEKSLAGEGDGAKFEFLHTLAHIMMKTLPVYCGVDANQLGEKIYDGPQYSAIMIFSREPGDVKLGGMEDTLKRNMESWIDSWDALVDCPLEDADEEGCHYCSFVASGCIDFNQRISRQTLRKVFHRLVGFNAGD